MEFKEGMVCKKLRLNVFIVCQRSGSHRSKVEEIDFPGISSIYIFITQ
jgi:hypothetical protein